jgi:hypothetical protein
VSDTLALFGRSFRAAQFEYLCMATMSSRMMDFHRGQLAGIDTALVVEGLSRCGAWPCVLVLQVDGTDARFTWYGHPRGRQNLLQW